MFFFFAFTALHFCVGSLVGRPELLCGVGECQNLNVIVGKLYFPFECVNRMNGKCFIFRFSNDKLALYTPFGLTTYNLWHFIFNSGVCIIQYIVVFFSLHFSMFLHIACETELNSVRALRQWIGYSTKPITHSTLVDL